MNWLVFHIASGQSFFAGIALIILSVVASTNSKPLIKRFAFLTFLVGSIAIAISSTAIPYWYYAFAILATIPWTMSRFVERWEKWACCAAIVAWLGAAAIEIPYHITPRILSVDSRTITVVGDSITAGVGGGDTAKRWPTILADQHNLEVQDISQMGATVGAALKTVESSQIDSDVVIVEIGGNDLLGSGTAEMFATNLDALLAELRAENTQIFMFELPLPPFCNEYGRHQRAVAKKHGVALIPKRVLLSVLAANGSTLDTIHLTDSGHERMAACVWKLIGSAFREKSNN